MYETSQRPNLKSETQIHTWTHIEFYVIHFRGYAYVRWAYGDFSAIQDDAPSVVYCPGKYAKLSALHQKIVRGISPLFLCG